MNATEIKHKRAEKLTKFFHLVPLHKKKAVMTNWPDNCSNDPEVVATWKTKYKPATGSINYGVVCGEKSQVWVLDIDDKGDKKGTESLHKAFGDMPETVTVDTPSGGKHYYFNLPSDFEVTNGTDILGVDSGVDVRGTHGYVATFPSDGYSVPSIPEGGGLDTFADAPEALLEHMKKRKADKKTSKTGPVEVPEEDLREAVMSLDIDHKDFNSRDGWHEIMRATHSASGGEDWGRSLFEEWSVKSTKHDESAQLSAIEAGWGSYGPGEQTVATIYYYMKEHGVIASSPPVEETLAIGTVRPFDSVVCRGNKGRLKPTLYTMSELFRCEDVDADTVSGITNLFVKNELTQKICFFRSPPWGSKAKAGTPISDT